MGNTKSIGVAFSDQDISGSDVIESAGVLGYTAAAQGTVTQATSKATAVTLNKSAGRITMNGAALAGNTAVSFTLNNSYISSNDIIILNISGGAVADATAYTIYVSNMTTGSATITLRNLTGTSQSEAVVVNFALIHCA
jgi:hypothetical protein